MDLFASQKKMEKKKFAVIFFPNENIYSEVPISWLTKTKKQCWWPNTLNASVFMNRGDLPQKDTWTLHDIRVEIYCSTLNGARKKAEDPNYSSSQEQVMKGRGFRKKKTTTYNSDETSGSDLSCTPPPTPPPKHEVMLLKNLETEVSNSNSLVSLSKEKSGLSIYSVDIQRPANFETDILQMSNAASLKSSSVCSSGTVSIAESSSNPIIIEVSNHAPITEDTPIIFEKDESSDESTLKKLSTQLSEVNTRLVKIEKLLESMGKRMTICSDGEKYTKKMEELLAQVPLENIENIDILEQAIKEEEMKETYTKFVQRIGGKDGRDSVNRCLSSVFKNDLAIKCSLVGFRGNFRLEGYQFMSIIEDTIIIQLRSNKFEVQKLITEWFRLSKQRVAREKKKITDVLLRVRGCMNRPV